MASGPITLWQVEGEKVETVKDFLFMGSNITEDDDCGRELRRWLLLGRKAMTNLHTVYVEKERHHSANKGPRSQGYGLSSGHIWLWDLDHKESRTPKFWRLWTVVLEKTPENP